ncbi:hypothetical protein [Tropicimonas isoalkanivorans]|uniref:Uncharacterized protein n=1 Tax=Tropicimonas isoalkanivorans TaxID=441112 RepID=A0A1I1G3D6_9RHOB|nr:hypothetical protein [Tropicimonas isoalkanivorans]SFC03823.1 hypothetical protein SAMN04488094_102319 [Tropicimonas isoalkanivorans]
MSEPVTNAEIEDVLLSIRRLVQGDARTEPDVEEPEPADAAAPEAPDAAPTPFSARVEKPESERHAPPRPRTRTETPALILTPSLRVTEEETIDAPAEVASLDAANQDMVTDASPVPEEPEAAEVADPDEDGEAAILPEDTSPVAEAEQPAEPKDDVSGDATPEIPVAEVPSFVRAAVERRNRAAASQQGRPASAGDGATSPQSVSEDAESGGDSTFASRNAPRAGFRFGTHADPNVYNLPTFRHSPANRDSASDDRDSASDQQRPPSLTDDVVPMMPSFRAHARQGAAAAEAPGNGAGDHPSRLETPTDVAKSSAASGAYGSGLDADALSALISECVHKELQGELGERITRNVRKLVRREIHRALSMRDFE